MKKIQLTATILLGIVFLLTTASAQDNSRQGDENTKQIFTERSKENTETIAPFSVFVVNNNGDATDAVPGDGICETAASNGICTLRAAVVESNALAGNDTITFDSSVTTISVKGQIAISSNISIIGNGASSLTIQNTAALSTTSRVFNITNFIVSLSGMTITGGNVTGSGGAIQNTGNLTITNCVINGNMASSTGGGVRSTNNLTIYNSVVSNNASTASTSGGISFAGVNLTIRNTTISSNTSSGNGGGINISASASATISNSTISGNTAGASSGGFFTNRGTITNTTISGNTANGALATDGGGGVRIQAGANSVSFISCTITDNTAPNSTSGARSGIWHETGTINLSNSIVAGNVAQDIQRDGTGVIVSNGFNLIGENTSVTTEFPEGQPNASNDYVGTDAMPINPMIAALADNGGATQTHALLKGSAAIDKGNSFNLDADQRGYIRTIDLPIPNAPTGDGTDIGAFEFQSMPNTVGFSVSGRVSDGFGSGVSRILVVLTDDEGNVSGAVTNNFGYFSFENVAAGESYIVSVQSKEYQFTPQVITVNDDITGLEITALP
jgi:hypothetical protein